VKTAGAASTLTEIAANVRDGALSPVILTGRCLDRIDRLNPTLNAFITVTADAARARARTAAVEAAAGNWRGPLHGIPVAVKDFYDTAGVRTTAGFEQFERRVPARDAVLVSALRDAGAVLVGKTNMHKLGMGTTSLESHFGPVVNPWDPERVAGGSSGGSAVAVATGMCWATVDTDAVGSGRLPAAICGVACFKPTFGVLDPTGILAGEPADPAVITLGHPSVMARTAADVMLVFESLAGSAQSGTTADGSNTGDAQRRLGIVTNFTGDAVVKTAFEKFTETLESLEQTSVTRVEAPFAAASFDLRHVEQDRASISETLFRDLDAIVLPTLTALPPTVADARAQGALAVSSQNTFFCNYFGLPAVSVPIAHEGALPLAVQFVGRRNGDVSVLALARAWEQATGGTFVAPPERT
jgi:aspartyl-tRNA(Asn)/glutamyl-tRNA(Gln) amidotransferase subunit A